jgi:hypothetical protein
MQFGLGDGAQPVDGKALLTKRSYTLFTVTESANRLISGTVQPAAG